MRTILRLIGQAVRALFAAAALTALLAGIPYGLIRFIGWPLPHEVPTGQQIVDALTSQLTDDMLLNILAVLLWIVWFLLAVAILREGITALRYRSLRRAMPRGPLGAIAVTLLGAFVIGTTTTALAPPRPMPVTATAADPPRARPDLPFPTVTPAVAQPAAIPEPARAATYTVREGDSLWDIAETCLGDPTRWTEIYDANKNRIQPDGRALTDPDLIQPGWNLRIPANATPARPPAKPAPQPPQPPKNQPDPSPETPEPATPTPPPTGSPTPAPSGDADDGVIPAPPGQTAGSPRSPATPTTPPTPPVPEERDQTAAPDRPGVQLPGGWIGLPLAAAVISAATLVWLRRRHRYVPRPLGANRDDDPDLRPLPPVVTQARRGVREQAPELLSTPPQAPTVADYAQTGAADLPPIGPSSPELVGLSDPLPPLGLGLAGPGSHAAARALLAAALSAGGPGDPDARSHLIVPADTLTTLLGAHAMQIGDFPRMEVTATLPDALIRAEELLIERRRVLQDYDVDTAEELRATDPYSPPMPPVVLLVEAPPPQTQARLMATLQLGAPLRISGVLLGPWPPGHTEIIDEDGNAEGSRLATLDVPTTLQLLEVLHEAHTGTPPPATATPGSPAEPAQTIPDTDPGLRPDAPAAAAPASADTSETASPVLAVTGPTPGIRDRRTAVRIHVLGQPQIAGQDDQPVTGIRRNATQLLVYLTIHRSGEDLPQIMEAIWPSATLRRASERLNTEASHLRGRIRHAADDKTVQPVINLGGRYVLNADLLDVDLWRMTDALRRARAARDDPAQITALREAVEAHTGGLADGEDYEWIEQYREQVRRNGIGARLHLADLISNDHPAEAAALTQAAADLDPYSEEAARRAMRALASIGDTAAITTRLHALQHALDEIDEEPSPDTLTLANQLRHDANRPHPRPPNG